MFSTKSIMDCDTEEELGPVYRISRLVLCKDSYRTQIEARIKFFVIKKRQRVRVTVPNEPKKKGQRKQEV
jgi:hypothetical protein